MTRLLPPDHARRHLIRTALDENLLVEAGAGSGKTTALVDRMLRLIAGGTATTAEIAAVTFTRKAAGELRQRFQERLEEAVADHRLAPDEETFDDTTAARLHAALRTIDRAFMGTIHAFCARLLRERPLAARLDPGFRELTAPEQEQLARRYWEVFLERLTAEDDPRLADLAAVGLRPSQLFRSFTELSEASDVTFPPGDASPPPAEAVRRVRDALDEALDAARAHLPDPPDKKCALQKRVAQLLYLRAVHDWDRLPEFMEAVHALCSSKRLSATLKRWPLGTSEVRALEERFNELIEVTDERPSPPARALLARWQAHCHRPVMALLDDAVAGFAEHRRSTGQLTFHDLLQRATELLRHSPDARRGLGLRWRRILVDEFQDTDPLQAELLFLLAADPADDPPSDGDGPLPWIRLVPRPGALFVVGDPKQSIYRFRRADIALYGRVRTRFEDFGTVVRLDANFRSTAPIEAVVAGVFDPAQGGLFPLHGNEHQAAYAPLLTQPRRTPAPREGVFHYLIPDDVGRSRRDLARWEAPALAEWIRQRVERGERRPEDFLVLTHTKHHLSTYARAIEARHIPVMVSGSGVGIEDELRELRIVLRSLVDPDNPLLTVAALEGLFFGLDPRQLLLHVEAGGRLDYRVTQSPEGPVRDALAQLRRWWDAARDRPADEAIEAVVASVGLLPWAASGALGGLRAGALAFTLDLVRSAAVSDDASLAGALDALDLILESDDADVETPIQPGRGGAVRLMNLHKAKGLEAPVVILAHPTGRMQTGRSLVVERDADGTSVGWCATGERRGPYDWRILSAPEGWDGLVARETAFEKAEHDRLLYVAVTRAGEELVVGMKHPRRRDRGPWAALEEWLGQESEPITLAPAPEPDRPVVDVAVETLREREAEARRRRDDASVPHFHFATVTGAAHVGSAATEPGAPETGVLDLFDPPDVTTEILETEKGLGGVGWGSAVHAALEQALLGREGRVIEEVARATLMEHARPVDERGDPVELPLLLAVVEQIRTSELWARALAAEVRLTEHPFAVEIEKGRWLEGVIDLAFREPEGWVIVDYKTSSDDRAFEILLPHYERQVALYATAWRRLTGEPVADARIWRVG